MSKLIVIAIYLVSFKIVRHHHAAEVQELIEAPRPAAIEYFTIKEMEAKSKRQLAIDDVPAAMAVQFFTEKARIEKERKAAEIQAIKENPPPPSLAGQHFKKVNEARKIEIEEMMNEPAPMAIEYFTQKARDDKQRQELSMKSSDEQPVVAFLATRHFADQQVKKAQEMDALRSQVKEGGRDSGHQGESAATELGGAAFQEGERGAQD